MTNWKARFEKMSRADTRRAAHRRLPVGRSVSGDHRELRIHGDDRSARRCDCTLHIQIAPRPSKVEARHDGDAMVVAVAGDFDLVLAESVRELLTRAITERRQRLIVDLGKVTFIDSSGLHVILDTHRLCRGVEPRLTIRPGPPNVQKVFELTNVLDRLPFEFTG